MAHTKLSLKKNRIIENDVETLFSPRAILHTNSFDELKRLGPFHPSVNCKNGTLFLSEIGIAALKRLVESISTSHELEGFVSNRDIYKQAKAIYADYLEKGLQPDGQEFASDCINALSDQIRRYEFLVKIDGINLSDQDALSLGSFKILHASPALFDSVEFDGRLDRSTVFSQFKDSLWLLGSTEGSADIASEKFEYQTVLIVGILGICAAILYTGAIRRSRVRAFTSPLENRKAISSLRWETGGKNPCLTRKWGAEQDLPLNLESVTYLNDECFLSQLSNLLDKKHRSELDEAIVRSVYWFAEAYKDRNPTMQFVKLWTCVECFFAIDKEKVTELNANGLAAILTFAGYKVVDPIDYPNFKRRVKHLYGLRSKAVHRAEFGHIDDSDIDDFSCWVAWVVISMVSLAERGYTTLRQIHEQINRLDKISSRKQS